MQKFPRFPNKVEKGIIFILIFRSAYTSIYIIHTLNLKTNQKNEKEILP